MSTHDRNFTTEESEIAVCFSRVSTHIKSQGIKIEKWRIVGPLRDRLLTQATQIPRRVHEIGTALINQLNASMA